MGVVGVVAAVRVMVGVVGVLLPQCVWYGAGASFAAVETVVPAVVAAQRAALGALLPVLRKHRLALQQLQLP